MSILTENPELGKNSIYIFRDKDILVHKDGSLPDAAETEKLLEYDSFKFFFTDTCTNCCGGELKQISKNKDAIAAELNPNIAAITKKLNINQTAELLESTEKILKTFNLLFMPIRQYFFETSEREGALAARMKAYCNWLNTTKYCCNCGSKLELYPKENALICSSCKKIHFPRIEPCIIVLIHKDEKVLLLRHSYRNQNIYTCLAGFIESGETVEQAVEREVMEETGIQIKNLRYAGSQGWPYPDQLMLAFHADYKCGDIKIDPEEIAEAKWLNPAEVENIPLPGSVAWKLINNKF